MSLPSKKRKLSDEASLPSIDVTSPKGPPRKDSGASATSDDTAAMALKALSALDAAHHGRHAPLKKRKASLDSSMESDQALGLAPLGAAAPKNESVADCTSKAETPPKSNTEKGSGTALDHLDALGDDAASMGSKEKVAAKQPDAMIGDEASGNSGSLASSNQRVLLDALASSNSTARRDRLESWGGMSDLSATGLGGGDRLGDAAAALAASALHYTGLIEDVTLSAAQRPRASSLGSLSSGELNVKPSAVPSRISLGGRDRKSSVASEFSMIGDGGSEQMAPTIQAFVDAAMATVGDQLEDLAGAVEMAASGADVASISSDYLRKEAGTDSDVSSTMSPLIGPVSDFAAARGRARSLSSSSKPLSVDYNAVAAAVNAAEAVTGALDLSAIPSGTTAAPVPLVVSSSGTKRKGSNSSNDEVPKSSMSEKDLKALRARAREAAGYVPPSAKDETPEPRPPLKKRPKQPTPEKTPSGPYPDMSTSTPRVSNVGRELVVGPFHELVPLPVPSAATSSVSRVATQKWEDMFECLGRYIDEQKAKATKGLSDKEKKEWEWDGNVPTTYKTPDGKALGRWVNNQRSAKTKGTLKRDREEKLLSTGLRFTILSTSSWQDMMNELCRYVEEKTKDGKEWDGNVPTNYKIKRKDGDGEEKNLGRWVNRQRSAKQNGKLRKEREEQLDAVGLRWSILTTSSWDDMYEILEQYVKERKELDPKNSWDGNVPANYKTKDDPPKALGRWINRQRSNYVKKKIKKEHVDKLEAIGLLWSVHDRSRYQYPLPTRSTPVVANPPNPVPSQVSTSKEASVSNKEVSSSKEVATSNANASSSSSKKQVSSEEAANPKKKAANVSAPESSGVVSSSSEEKVSTGIDNKSKGEQVKIAV